MCSNHERNQRRKQRYAEDEEYREQTRAYNRAWHAANKERVNAESRQQWHEDPTRKLKQREYRQKSQRKDHLKYYYGITVEEYNAILARQNGCCRICKRKVKGNLCVDHDHKTGKVRGLLCRTCNPGCGHLRDDPKLARIAADYLADGGDWITRRSWREAARDWFGPFAKLLRRVCSGVGWVEQHKGVYARLRGLLRNPSLVPAGERMGFAQGRSTHPTPLPADRADTLAQRGDQVGAVGEVALLDVEHACEAALLQRQHVDQVVRAVDARGVADDVDQPLERMQAAEQVVVLAIGAREKRGEVTEADALEALDPGEALERAGVLRADAVDQDLVELADLARAADRERQHVPERKAEIVDQHLAPRLRMPKRRIERAQQVIELAGRGVEPDLLPQLLDQPVELAGVARHNIARVIGEMPDLPGRRRRRKDVRHQVADRVAVERRILALAQGVEPAVELALEPIDHHRIEPGEALLADQLIEPVLPLDQEMQAPLAILDVESQQILDPAGNAVGGLGLELERLAVGALVDDALGERPGVDDLGHHARHRRLRGNAAQLDDQLRAEGAHRGELEPDVGLVGEAGVDGDVRVDL